MAMKRRALRLELKADDAAWLAAFLGDSCPPQFNHFTFLDREDAVRCPRCVSPATLASAQDAWSRLGATADQVWSERKRRGRPPGASLERC
jgi:hypothetical protein